jgi:mannose-6-phosphate isomerase-like protein (cupin superfamily)
LCSGDADAAAFDDRGFIGPVRLLSNGQRTLMLNHLAFGGRIKSETWSKATAVHDRLWFDLASRPELLALLRPLLGENIILWGATVVDRLPGQAHEWHVDIESSDPDRRHASVWIGLINIGRESGLTFVSGSHGFGKTIQEVRHRKGYQRGQASDETVLSWAREFDPAAELVQPDVADGDALVFDGRIWHGSLNRRDDTRIALLLQYAAVDAPVFIPDDKHLDWPFKLKSLRPPVIVVSGRGDGATNREVAPPPTSPKDAAQIVTEVRPLSPLPDPGDGGLRSYPLFGGMTEVHDVIGCHASVLRPGNVPHPPHAHIEEEILIVLDGQAELLVGDGPDLDDATAYKAEPGTFVYYPAYRHHTLRNTGSGLLTYLMFKWHGDPVSTDDPLAICIVDSQDRPPQQPNPWLTRLPFEGPTNFLGKLHSHFSEIAPGGGYEPHADPYDVAIVVLSGIVETVGRKVEPFGVVYYAAGEPHGLRSVGTEPARYVVFEFHGVDRSGGREKSRGSVRRQKKPLLHRLGKLAMAPIRHYTKQRRSRDAKGA